MKWKNLKRLIMCNNKNNNDTTIRNSSQSHKSKISYVGHQVNDTRVWVYFESKYLKVAVVYVEYKGDKS